MPKGGIGGFEVVEEGDVWKERTINNKCKEALKKSQIEKEKTKKQ